MSDVAYNVAYFQAVANGFTRQEGQKAAEEARDRAKKPKWVPNEYLVMNANDKGLTLADKTFLRWNQAAKQVGRLTIQPGRKEGLLTRIRRVFVRANGERLHIAAVGKAIAGL